MTANRSDSCKPRCSRWNAVARCAVFCFGAAAMLAASSGHAENTAPGSGGAKELRLVDASSNNFPPINLLDGDGRLTGFGAEMADAVVRAVGGKVEHIHSAIWTEVLGWIDSGRADFIHDTGYTKDRDKFLDYSDPVLEMPETIFVRRDQQDITSLDSLKGRKVACVNQHISHLFLEKFPDITCRITKTPAEGLDALIKGDVDAFIYPRQVLVYLAQNSGVADKIKMTGAPLRTLTWSMVVKEGNTETLRLLNQGLAKIRTSGEYQRIYDKWLGKAVLTGYRLEEIYVVVASAAALALLFGGLAGLVLFGRRRFVVAGVPATVGGTAASGGDPWRLDLASNWFVSLKSLPVGLIGLSAGLAAATFAFDLNMPLGVAGGVPYVAIVLAGLWSPWRPFVLVLAAVATALTVLGYALSAAGSAEWMVLTNRALAIFAIWAASALVYDRKQSMDAVETARGSLERTVSERTAELRQTLAELKDQAIERERASEAARDSEALQSAVLAGSLDPIVTINSRGIIQSASYSLETVFGWKPEDIIGKNVKMLMPEPYRSGHGEFLDTYRRTRKSKIIGVTREFRAVRKDGTIFPCELSVAKVELPESVGGGLFTGTIRDITERREAEDALRRLNVELDEKVRLRTAELAASNKELEAFAYSVSHDLRAPLRALDGFSRILLDEYGERLDRQAVHYLARIRAGSTQMARLIDDLLEMSRATRRELKRERVDLSSLADLVAAWLKLGEPDRKVDIRIAPDLAATTDEGALKIVLENLIGNAWKYTRNAKAAQVEFGSTTQDGAKVYFVRDNGAGFNMAYADRLFRPFERLHGESVFEGSGIGLATVRQVINRLGGDIWAEAEEGAGATFYFTL